MAVVLDDRLLVDRAVDRVVEHEGHDLRRRHVTAPAHHNDNGGGTPQGTPPSPNYYQSLTNNTTKHFPTATAVARTHTTPRTRSTQHARRTNLHPRAVHAIVLLGLPPDPHLAAAAAGTGGHQPSKCQTT